MTRPKGSLDKQPRKERISAPSVSTRHTADQTLEYKLQIIRLLENGEIFTLTAAAQALGISAATVQYWANRDEEFAESVKLAKEVLADQLEVKLAAHSNFIPQMFMLKGIRPWYRDNYKVPPTTSEAKELLQQLVALGKQAVKEEIIEETK